MTITTLNPSPAIVIAMGSQSDWQTMEQAALLLQEFGINFETKIISAHRTPERLYTFAKNAQNQGVKVIIAGAGGAAHLPGMIASLTSLPVLGVPMETGALKGMDSLLSIVQMPAGVPVATFAIGMAGAKNAAVFAASILALSDQPLLEKLEQWRAKQTDSVTERPC